MYDRDLWNDTLGAKALVGGGMEDVPKCPRQDS